MGSVIACIVFELDDYREGYFDLRYLLVSTFWPLTVPAIINAYFAKYRGYLGHHLLEENSFHLSLFCLLSIGTS